MVVSAEVAAEVVVDSISVNKRNSFGFCKFGTS